MGAVLSPLQQAALNYIRTFLAENDQFPPMDTMRKHFGWLSNRTAVSAYEALQTKGLIERNVVGKYRFVREAAQ